MDNKEKAYEITKVGQMYVKENYSMCLFGNTFETTHDRSNSNRKYNHVIYVHFYDFKL